jgi:hypothetical protein
MSTCSVTRFLHHLIVTIKRTKLIALVLLAVIGGVTAYSLRHRSDEPEYEGRRLSEWLHYDRATYDYHETQVALRSIGTNAIPHLLKWIAYEPPAWQTTFNEKLPEFIINRSAVRGWLDEGELRARSATMGFRVLGTNAVSAIPELEALMNDATKPNSSSRAIYALSYIGEPAIPSLKAAFANTNRSDRWQVVFVFEQMTSSQETNA